MDNTKHILQIIPNLNIGGAEKFVCDLSNELSESKNKITVITFYDIDKNNFLYKSLKEDVDIISFSKKKGFDLSLIFKLRKAIYSLKPDFIHTHLRALNYVFFATFLKYKIIHTIHNDASKEVNSSLEGFFRKIIYKYFKVYPVTISKESNKSFIDYYSYPKQSSKIIFNGIPIDKTKEINKKAKDKIKDLKQKYGEDVKIFINIGRLEKQKNHILLCEAMNKVSNQGHNIILLIAGGFRNENSKKIKDKIDSFSNSRIVCLGEINNCIDYLKLSDYFVLSSHYEGMPISLIEAFSCNCIPIATPVGAMIEMIDKDGFLSKSLSLNDFKIAILKALKITLNQKQRIIKNNFKKYHNLYSMPSTAKKYLDYYEEVNKY